MSRQASYVCKSHAFNGQTSRLLWICLLVWPSSLYQLVVKQIGVIRRKAEEASEVGGNLHRKHLALFK